MLSVKQRQDRRSILEADGEFFTRYFFKVIEGSDFIVNQHHPILFNILQKVINGEITRLIINIPPGYTKTISAVICFIARGLALNPRSRFLHLSYSDDVAFDNSSKIRDIINSDEYQELWPVQLRTDTSAKKKWDTIEGGSLKAAPAAGSVTGFRAGRMEPGFHGAIIFDDPLKPDDAFSKPERNRVNNRIPNTVKSRIALETTPIILIMQRLHNEDPTAYLLSGGTGEMWHHLSIPALITAKKKKYPKEFTHGIPISHNLPPGPLWEYKQNLKDLEKIKKGNKYTYKSQYDQDPIDIGGNLVKDRFWKYYTVLPPMEYRFITGDTAQKTKEVNDYSCFGHWGFSEKRLYLIDLIWDKWEAPELKKQVTAFVDKSRPSPHNDNSSLRELDVEDKVSGTGLIQYFNREKIIPVKGIPANKDKLVRWMDGIPYIENGQVFLPERADWLSDYLLEMSSINGEMTHKHDDQADMTFYAIIVALVMAGPPAASLGYDPPPGAYHEKRDPEIQQEYA